MLETLFIYGLNVLVHYKLIITRSKVHYCINIKFLYICKMEFNFDNIFNTWLNYINNNDINFDNFFQTIYFEDSNSQFKWINEEEKLTNIKKLVFWINDKKVIQDETDNIKREIDLNYLRINSINPIYSGEKESIQLLWKIKNNKEKICAFLLLCSLHQNYFKSKLSEIIYNKAEEILEKKFLDIWHPNTKHFLPDFHSSIINKDDKTEEIINQTAQEHTKLFKSYIIANIEIK